MIRLWIGRGAPAIGADPVFRNGKPLVGPKVHCILHSGFPAKGPWVSNGYIY